MNPHRLPRVAGRSQAWQEQSVRRRRCAPRAWLAAAFLLLCSALLTGCAGLRRINAWPIYYRETGPEPGSSHTEVLWPFVEIDRRPDYWQLGVRPLLNVRRELAPRDKRRRSTAESWFGALPVRADQRTASTEVQALYPLFQTRREPARGRQKTWLLPLYYDQRQSTPQGERRFRVILPLLRVSGEVPGKGKFAATPFCGTIYDKLGYDQIDLLLFPLYLRTQADSRISRHLLFPLFSSTRAGDYWYIRAWPLAGCARRSGKFAHGFLLWPFFSYRVQQAADGAVARTFFFFPFYGYSNGPRAESWTVLWPFFSHQKVPGRQYEAWNVPSPFLRFHPPLPPRERL